jgi:hypothetical protein
VSCELRPAGTERLLLSRFLAAQEAAAADCLPKRSSASKLSATLIPGTGSSLARGS